MDTIKCGKCENGTQTWDEDGRTVRDICYHCAGTGRIDEELAEHDALNEVAHVLGDAYMQWRCEPSDEEDGWDVGLAAAENMMSVRDYKMSIAYDHAAEFAEEIQKLSPALQRALKCALATKPEKVPAPTPVVVEPKKPEAEADLSSEDEIPF